MVSCTAGLIFHASLISICGRNKHKNKPNHQITKQDAEEPGETRSRSTKCRGRRGIGPGRPLAVGGGDHVHDGLRLGPRDEHAVPDGDHQVLPVLVPERPAEEVGRRRVAAGRGRGGGVGEEPTEMAVEVRRRGRDERGGPAAEGAN